MIISGYLKQPQEIVVGEYQDGFGSDTPSLLCNIFRISDMGWVEIEN